MAPAASPVPSFARLARRLRGGAPSAGPRFAFDLVAAPPAGAAAAALVYRRRALRPRPVPLIGRADAADVFLVAGAAALAATATPAAWDDWCRRLAASGIKRGPRGPAHVRAGLAAAGLDPAAAAAVHEAGRARLFRQWMLYAAELAGRGPAEVAFAAEDVGRLRAALARGRGAIVWIDETFAAPVLSKRALAEAGLAPRHVSVATHGGSFSEFGAAALNPRHVRAENRHLAERLTFAEDEPTEVVRRVLHALAAGGLVTMTNGVFAGAGFVELPFGDGGFVSLSTTPIGLAARHGAPLFSLAAIEEAPFARYRIDLGPEIAVAGGRDPGAVAAAAAQVRDLMLERLRRWPDQYPGLPGARFGPTLFPDARGPAAPPA
jgi:hypothetical protein